MSHLFEFDAMIHKVEDRDGAYVICHYDIRQLYGKGRIETSTCDKLLCEKCTNKLNGKDYCIEHIKLLKKELKLGDDKR